MVDVNNEVSERLTQGISKLGVWISTEFQSVVGQKTNVVVHVMTYDGFLV